MSNRVLLKFGLPLIVGLALCYFFPLFHIRSLGDHANNASAKDRAKEKATDAANYVEDFWNGPLRAGDDAIDIATLGEAFATDAEQAKKEFGRQVGLGGPSYFCVRGHGTVDKVEANRCTIIVPELSQSVCLELGALVDNTIRSTFGVNVNEFSNAQDFNNVSAELNRRVESEVIQPSSDKLKPGVSVSFVGCAKISGKSDWDPLCLVPIRLEISDLGTTN